MSVLLGAGNRCSRSAPSLSSSHGNAARPSTMAKLEPHSRPHYHGWWAFLLATLPATFMLLASGCSASSIYLERHIVAQLPEQTADSPIASQSLSIGLVKSLANGLRRLDARRRLPATFAELQPLLAAKGVALATDTQDYMIPIAVEANRMQGPARHGRRDRCLRSLGRRRRLRGPAGRGARSAPATTSSR